MSKKNIKTEVQNNEVVVIPTVNIVEKNVKFPGRPINPNSPRQQRLKEQELKMMSGYVPQRGRPVNPDSTRQHRLSTINSGVLGRPCNPDSDRQKRLSLKGTLPLGRPKKVIINNDEETID